MAEIFRNERIKWTNRVLGLVAASWGFALGERIALAVFGASLIFELWIVQGEVSEAAKAIREMAGMMEKSERDNQALVSSIDSRINNALQYEYLPDPPHIWVTARDILARVQQDDEIQSTASSPNDPTFEALIFDRVVHSHLVYKRLVCYVKRKIEPNQGNPRFPPVELIHGESQGDLLKSYEVWYGKFYMAWEAALRGGREANIESLGMKVWDEALRILASRISRFSARFHPSDIPSDYFILSPLDGVHWKAIVGFPRLRREGMRGGFATTNSHLAKDLSLNWLRLWEQAQELGTAGQDDGNPWS